MTRDGYSHMTFHEYWTTYLPDLIENLPEQDRSLITNVLANGFLDGDSPGRESVQRLIELHLGIISRAQHSSWVLSHATGDGSQHIVDRLREGFLVGGSREKMIDYLANVDYSETFADRVKQAGAEGLLTAAEVDHVLTTSLRNPPLPPLIERPPEVPALPFDRHRGDREPYRPSPVKTVEEPHRHV